MPDTVRLSIACPAESAELVQEFIWTLPYIDSICESYTLEEEDNGVEQFQELQVFSSHPETEMAIAELLQHTPLLKPLHCQVLDRTLIQPEDWENSWKQFWHVQSITPTLIICPSWETYVPKAGERVITLDPGLAFGTGTHETTRLMMEAVEQLAESKHDGKSFDQLSVLDVGTGSGVLAILCALLGCKTVMAIDIDPVCIEATTQNATLNHVSSYIHVTDTPLEALCQTKHEIILANILGATILELLPEMCVRLQPGGTLITSGLIASSVEVVEAAMRSAGFKQLKKQQLGSWYSLQGRYNP